MQIQVNGHSQVLDGAATVADLLKNLDIRLDRVAVELNLEILERGEFDHRRLQDGDRVEIISFIGGGSAAIRDRCGDSVSGRGDRRREVFQVKE